MKRTLIVLCGPTATGKTQLGVALCQAIGGEVISADSMQVYRGMDIGTAKPSLEEQGGIPHHMLSVIDPQERYSVARYVEEATACVEDIFARGKQPVVVGGTGLYIDALCRGVVFAQEDIDEALRHRLQSEAKEQGSAALWQKLQHLDPESAQNLHPNDEKRVIRALEIFLQTGKPLALHNRESSQQEARYARCLIGLNYSIRADLYTRINHRVDEMLQAGLLGEVDALLEQGLPSDATALQAIGYKEILRAREEGWTVPQTVEEIKLRSRQYAKRQLSWFRRASDLHWLLWNKMPDFSIGLQNSISFLQREGLK